METVLVTLLVTLSVQETFCQLRSGAQCACNKNCPQNLACIQQQCKSPCTPNTCGLNAECQVNFHVPICSCKPGFEFVQGQCRPGSQCACNEDCPQNLACIQQQCKTPCTPNKCGINADCKVINHVPICSCKPGYELIEGECRSTPNCTRNEDCPQNLACIQQQCKSPCKSNTCGLNADCKVNLHIPFCSCKPGFELIEGQCRSKPNCTRNEDCPQNLACIQQQCKSPCTPNKCGPNADCKVNLHIAICFCKPGFELIEGQCQRITPSCASNEDCLDSLACIQQQCQNPCTGFVCIPNAHCTVQLHEAICICKPGFQVIHGQCQPVTSCTCNEDCLESLACIQQRCQSPCTGVVCSPNSHCIVQHHKAMCICNPGAQVIEGQCQPVTSCGRNEDCLQSLACIQQQCQSPCTQMLCGPNSDCIVNLHKASCFCKPGFNLIGGECRPSTQCGRNEDCEQCLACIQQQCQSPCTQIICGPNSDCIVTLHEASCSCKPGFNLIDGECRSATSCEKNEDCPQSLTCVQQQCQNPCTYFVCGPNSDCIVKLHKPSCSCKPGFCFIQGECRSCVGPPVQGCKLNSDCIKGQRCINHNCKTLCPGRCGSSLECSIVHITPYCHCKEGYTMNNDQTCRPYTPTSPTEAPQNETESGLRCKDDHACDPDRHCRQNECVNPCTSHSCAHGSICYVHNNQPICLSIRPFSTGKGSDVGLKKHFYISSIKLTWIQAYADCWERGMMMANVRSSEENNDLRGKLDSLGRPEGVWLGSIFHRAEKGWYWMASGYSLESFSVMAQSVNNVNGSTLKGFCLSTAHADGGRNKIWTNFKCKDSNYFACEYYALH